MYAKDWKTSQKEGLLRQAPKNKNQNSVDRKGIAKQSLDDELEITE